VQALALLSYLAEERGIWGPFLVVAPASTLHNWDAELTAFAPALKVCVGCFLCGVCYVRGASGRARALVEGTGGGGGGERVPRMSRLCSALVNPTNTLQKNQQPTF
jgi:hypothetical protein